VTLIKIKIKGIEIALWGQQVLSGALIFCEEEPCKIHQIRPWASCAFDLRVQNCFHCVPRNLSTCRSFSEGSTLQVEYTINPSFLSMLQ
jgi:hypothetical protein